MIQGGGRPGLPHETPFALRIADRLGGEKLQGDLAVQAGVHRAVHDAHSPSPSFSRIR